MRMQQHEKQHEGYNEQEARGEARTAPTSSLSRGAMHATQTPAASAAFGAHDGAHDGVHELTGDHLDGLVIHRNDAQRLLLINDIPIQFSPLEYRVMLALVARIGAPVSFETLTRAATWPGEAPCSRVALERHIDRIRQKLRVCEMEVRGVFGYGCVLLWSRTSVYNC